MSSNGYKVHWRPGAWAMEHGKGPQRGPLPPPPQVLPAEADMAAMAERVRRLEAQVQVLTWHLRRRKGR